MKTGTKIKIAIIIFLFVGTHIANSIITAYLLKCDEQGGSITDVVPSDPEGPIITTNQNDAYLCGKTINIAGAMLEGNFFRVRAWNDCMENYRTFEMKIACPNNLFIRPYSVQLQLFLLAGYSKQLQKFNSLAGGTVSFLWNYKNGSVGFGVMYAQSIIFEEYYCGASFIGQIDFGKRKEIKNNNLNVFEVM